MRGESLQTHQCSLCSCKHTDKYVLGVSASWKINDQGNQQRTRERAETDSAFPN